MPEETANLTVEGDLASIAKTRSWLSDLLSQSCVPETIIADLQLAVTELCTNIVRHGYGEKDKGDLEIQVTKEGNSIRVTIEDTAPIYALEESTTDLPDSLEEGGRGIFLMHSLVDEVIHEAVGRKGNRTTLVKEYNSLSSG